MLRNNLFALFAGICAAGAGFFGKLSGYVYESFDIYGSIMCLVGMILLNAAMWKFYSKALSLSPTSVGPTVISSATNYLLSGVLGVIIFGESTSLLWWSGTGMVLTGLLLLTRGKQKEHVS